MAGIFKRYAGPARRALFLARARALFDDGPEISSVDLLAGPMFDETSRAQSLFTLREFFPMYRGCPRRVTKLPDGNKGPDLDAYSKQALAWTVTEAARLGDYWIDTEHLLLGILRVSASPAASCLAMTGLTLDAARKRIQENKANRPDYGRVPTHWRLTGRLRSFIEVNWIL